MKHLLLALFLAIPAAAQIATDEAVRELLDGPTVGGSYSIGAGTFRPGSLFVNRGDLSGTADNPVVITGAGISETIIECPSVCYFEPNQHVTFRDLTIRGAWNSRHLRNFTFERVRFDDPEAIGWRQKVLWKTTGAPVPYVNPVDVGAGPIFFRECEFAPHPDGTDTALDFVATQGVQITDSIWERCNRGCLQAKGGSGIKVAFVIARNWIRDGGSRGIFLGGGTDWNLFDPPIEEAKAEFGSAEVYDNIIEGGDRDISACFTVGTAAGPIDFHHNLCLGQSGHLFRLIDENQHPATIEGVRNVTIRNSIVAQWKPPQWPNTNVLSTSLANSIRWETIKLADLVFDMASRKKFWGWPEADPLPTVGIIENVTVEIVRDPGGRPRVVGWEDYGPRPVVIDESVGKMSLFVGQNGKLYSTAEAAKRAGEFVEIMVEVAR